MRGIAHYAPTSRIAAALKLERKHQHRQLRLRVRPRGRIGSRTLQIVKIDHAPAMREAGEVDHAGLIAATKQGKQMRRERVMAEIIGTELHLEPVGGGLPL